MIRSSLRLLSMFILPNPKFTIPPSITDPYYRVRRASADYDTSYIFDTALPATPTRQRAHSTPRRTAFLEREETAERRRNTVCCCSCHCPESPQRLISVAQSESRRSFAFLRQDNSGVTDDSPLPSSRASGASINRIIQNSPSSYHGSSGGRRDCFRPSIPLHSVVCAESTYGKFCG